MNALARIDGLRSAAKRWLVACRTRPVADAAREPRRESGRLAVSPPAGSPVPTPLAAFAPVHLSAHADVSAPRSRPGPAPPRLPLSSRDYSACAADLPATAPSKDPNELAALLGRVGLGDRAAFATLYRATSAHLLGVILRINPDRGQGEDVLQEIYVNVWRSAGGFDAARAQPLTWLTSIARNGAIDSLRRAKARVQTVSSHVGSAEAGDEADLADQVASDDPGPLQLLQRAAEKREVEHCVGRLSAEQQQCVALAYYQGLSHSQVAEQLAHPLGTVKSWMRRALLALKDCLTRAASVGG